MGLEKDIKSYSYFTFEDFLQDDFFIESILNPTEESELFWENFQKENKEKLSDFHKAIKCIKDINKNVLDDNDVEKIWAGIRTSNKKGPAKNKIIYIVGWAVAASIALLFILRFYVFSPIQDINEQGIREFASKNISAAEAADMQLILSDNKVISLSDQESVILYDSTSIKVSSRKIVKDEILKNEVSAFNQLIIPKGKRSFLTLSDGTRIWVNSGTRLVYPVEFKADKREIFVDGEIYLNVQPNQNRPFIVQTGNMDIQVLGTEFNVQAYSADVQKRVVLKSGAVKISSGTNNPDILLHPSDMYELNGDKEKVAQVDINIYTSWVSGIYICENERLDIILTRLSRYYGKEIIVDKNAAGLKCNGKLDLKENMDDVMSIIRYIAPVNYTYENDKYVVTYKH